MEKSIIVKVNDRGPFAPNRIIDLSYAAAKKLGYANEGTALVQVTTIDTDNTIKTPTSPQLAQPRLYLQLGAFANHANAALLQTRLKHLTKRQVRIQTGQNRRKAIYRVQIGPLTGVGESDQLQNTLANDGYGNALTVIR